MRSGQPVAQSGKRDQQAEETECEHRERSLRRTRLPPQRKAVSSIAFAQDRGDGGRPTSTA